MLSAAPKAFVVALEHAIFWETSFIAIVQDVKNPAEMLVVLFLFWHQLLNYKLHDSALQLACDWLKLQHGLEDLPNLVFCYLEIEIVLNPGVAQDLLRRWPRNRIICKELRNEILTISRDALPNSCLERPLTFPDISHYFLRRWAVEWCSAR